MIQPGAQQIKVRYTNNDDDEDDNNGRNTIIYDTILNIIMGRTTVAESTTITLTCTSDNSNIVNQNKEDELVEKN